ncbi:MAG: HIT family protein [Candidatus Niyogibacteria bacterium]|nr:HIT family protein [Candidatus Niyogibacteria bacterium]
MEDNLCFLCEAMDLKNGSWVTAWEPFPVNIGHMKIIPLRHEATLFDLTEKEESDFWDILKRTKAYLDTSLGKHKPSGYNVGINIGEAAGQTIMHLHIHMIPRYEGDVDNPRGGIRNIKPPLISW